MRRPPRPPREPLFGRRLVGVSSLQGVSVLAVVLAVFAVAQYRGEGEMGARALTFTTLVFANLGLILVNRSWSTTAIAGMGTRNSALWWVLGGTLAFLALVLSVSGLRALFRFGPLHAIDLAISFAAGAASLAWFELLKLVSARGRATLGGASPTTPRVTERARQAIVNLRQHGGVPASRLQPRLGLVRPIGALIIQ